MAIDIEQTLTYIRNHSKEYAQAKAARVHLEQFRKSKKAILMIDAEKQGVKTGQEREAYAYSHPEYLELLDGLKVAVEKEEYLSLIIKGCWAKIDLYRTEQATARAEQRAY